MTGALARTGERMTMDVTQGNDGNGHSTAAITLRNNCLQSQTGAELVATLLDCCRDRSGNEKDQYWRCHLRGNLPDRNRHLLPAWHPRSGASRSAR